MKIDLVSEKAILTSLAASVALANPASVDTTFMKKAVIFDASIDQQEPLRYGDRGLNVLSLQHKLQNYDLTITQEEVGTFGVSTHAAIRTFQKLKKLNVDGVAGPETMQLLFINNDISEVSVTDHILMKIQEGTLLRFGDKGDAVIELQKKLTDAGYYHFDKDGIFGSYTRKAVKDYQKDNGLFIDGIVGKETYKHLAGVFLTISTESLHEQNVLAPVYSNPEESELPVPSISTVVQKTEKNDLNKVDLLENGDRGQAVKDLQSLLKKKGFYRSKVDGVFGPVTEAAIRTYQLENQLTVDGIAGKSTIAHLKKITSKPLSSRSDHTSTHQKGTVDVVNETKDAPTSSNHLIEFAKTLIGTPYIWGGTTPIGFDCSGFLMYVYKKQGVSIPRTVSDIWSISTSVTSPQVGDLVFFQTYKNGPSHVGIYVGNDQFLHAGSSTGVTISDMTISYWSSRYLGAKRLQ